MKYALSSDLADHSTVLESTGKHDTLTNIILTSMFVKAKENNASARITPHHRQTDRNGLSLAFDFNLCVI